MRNIKTSAIFVVACVALLSGCAQKASLIVGENISSYRYENYTCEQLAKENERLATNIGLLSVQQDQLASHDQFVGPFLGNGNGGPLTEKLARYKGELEAVEITGIRRDCKFKLSLGY